MATTTLMALTTAVVVNSAPAPAHANPAPGWIWLENWTTGKVLQGRTTAKGAVVQQPAVPNGTPQGQQWLVVQRGTSRAGFPLVSFRNAGTSSQYALAISGGNPNNGGGAILWDYLSSHAEQEWELTSDLGVFPPAYTMRNYNSGKCLAIPAGNPANDTQAIQWTCNGLGDQIWVWRQ
jgi:hypothetical protein